ncbi:MAG: pyridoxamine 5'-phosphate oxidase family protein [Oscillospiraceae bacterium]
MFEEREIKDFDEIDALLAQSRVCRIALIDGDYPYIVPMCFGYNLQGGKLELYFCSPEKGRKVDLVSRNHKAAFEIDKLHEVVRPEEGFGIAALYRSITGTGEIELITGIDKITGLNLIFKKYGVSPAESKVSEQELNSMAVLKLTAEKFCCNANV